MKTISIKGLSFVALLTAGSIHAEERAGKPNQEPITTQERIKHGALGTVKAISTTGTAFLAGFIAYQIADTIYKTGALDTDSSIALSLVPGLVCSTIIVGASTWHSLVQAFQRSKQPTALKA